MGLQLDFLDVGDASAYLIRSFDERTGQEHVVLIDGGETKQHAQKVVEHLYNFTARRDCVDLIICTHPDQDHVGGLYYLVRDHKLRIGKVLAHDPYVFASANRKSYLRVVIETHYNVSETTKSLNTLTQFLDLLDQHNIPHQQPFSGILPIRLFDETELTILGPSKDYYAELALRLIEAAEKSVRDLVSEMQALGKSAEERLNDSKKNDKSASNASSVIFSLKHNGQIILYTGDATPEALTRVCEEYPNQTKNVKYLVVPHHGSHCNITAEMIDHFHPQVGIISAAATSDHHPSDDVVIYLNHVGASAYCTSQGNLLFEFPFLRREGYSSAPPYIAKILRKLLGIVR